MPCERLFGDREDSLSTRLMAFSNVIIVLAVFEILLEFVPEVKVSLNSATGNRW
jgi:hypothetical protein